jgi:glycosyltransferase involved in cell wall biosynthesis
MDQTTPRAPAPHGGTVLDITRLLVRAKRPTPSGIDRFEFAYADWLAHGPSSARFLVQWRTGALTVRPAAVSRFVTRLRRRWMGAGGAADDPAFRACAAFLEDRPRAGARAGGRKPDQRPLHQTIDLLRHLRTVGKPPADTLAGAPLIYLNIGHWHLERLARLKARFGGGARLRAVAYVHDLLPIETPEYFSADGRREAEQRMTAVARHADALLFTSQAMQASFAFHARRAGLRVPASLVLPPGIEEVFCGGGDLPPIRPARPYFVVCGNIEARKNHLMLVNIWRTMAAADGEAAPRLVVAGRRGWHAESVISALDRSPLMGTHIFEVAGLGTAGLAALLAGARALLMPSFTEGYGMPVAEARACGVPVVCSDIPSHREVGGPDAIYLDPIDGLGWIHEIRRLAAAPPAPRRPDAVMRWPQHFARLGDFLAELRATA